VRESLLELGKAGGIMDANGDLMAGSTTLIVESKLNLVNRNSSSHTAGLTFFRAVPRSRRNVRRALTFRFSKSADQIVK
jgi:hypothetical protein